MSRSYSPKNFMRLTPNAQIREYLALKGIGTDLTWEMLEENAVDEIHAVILRAPASTQREIDAEFANVMQLANEGGLKLLIDEGCKRFDVDLAPVFADIPSMTGRVLHAFVHYPQVFRIAQKYHHADQRHRRIRDDIPDVLPKLDAATTAALEAALAGYFRKEGRGATCHAEVFSRDDSFHWYCEVADFAQTVTVVDDELHCLRPQTQRPVFDVDFVYTPSTHTLAIASGGKKRDADLQQLFGRVIFSEEIGPPGQKNLYNLQGLLDRDFPFTVYAEDGVDHVRLCRLRVDILGRSRIELTALDRNDSSSIYDILDCLVVNGTPRVLMTVSYAAIQLVLRRPDGGRTTHMIEVTLPDTCSLTYGWKDEIAQWLLKRWGIYRGDGVTTRAGARRHRGQRVLPGFPGETLA